MPDTTNIVTFQANLAGFAEKLKIKRVLVVKKVAIDLWTKITERTPVATGRARANWMLTVDSPSEKVVGSELTAAQKADRAKTKDKFAESAPVFDEPLMSGISEIDGTQKVFIVNNLPYIKALEDGSSKQAPSGMVKVSIQEVANDIDRIAGSVK